MKTTHWELHYKKSGENNWRHLFPIIVDKNDVCMEVERRYAQDVLDSEVKLVKVETTTEYFDELV